MVTPETGIASDAFMVSGVDENGAAVDAVPPATGDIAVAGPGTFVQNYYAGFAQDEFRATSSVTLNVGVRYEFEQGLQEDDNRFTVGFDRNATFPAQVAGLDLKGGLMYAGQNGYPTVQGAPFKGQFAPRGGIAWSLSDRTVIRGGYGLFWAPTQFSGVTETVMGTRGYTASTSFLSSNDGGLTPAGSLSNPFPAGFAQPQGNSQGLMTGAGGVIDFVDQNSKPGYVQQYSVDYQWELPAGNSVGVGYMGSRSERLSMGGTSDVTVNINQLDPSYLALGTVCPGAESVLRQRGIRQLEPLGHDRARPAVASLSVHGRVRPSGESSPRAL
jgi:hypothetical protein